MATQISKTQTLQAGLHEIIIGDFRIPAELLGDVKTKLTMKTIEKDSQAGKIVRTTNMVDEFSVTFTLLIPNYDFLGRTIFPELYETATSGNGGRLAIGKGKVVLKERPIHITQKGSSNDDNDIHIFAGLPTIDFELDQNTEDEPTVEITINAQPTAEGYGYIGTGDLEQESVYDDKTQKSKAVTG